MSYFVYAIKSQLDERIYVGFTENIQKRLKEHNAGKTKSTKGYRPWVLIFTKECQTRLEARKLEKYYKGGSRKEKLKNRVP
jgi:putative endonuclease